MNNIELLTKAAKIAQYSSAKTRGRPSKMTDELLQNIKSLRQKGLKMSSIYQALVINKMCPYISYQSFVVSYNSRIKTDRRQKERIKKLTNS